MSNPSILPPEMCGVMFISGYRGIGKSFLASQADLPQNIVFFDFEEKGKGIDSNLKFGLYRALTAEATPSGRRKADPIRLHDITMAAFDSLAQDQFTVAILDNVSPFELALQAAAYRDIDHYCRAFGLVKKNVLAGRFGGVKSVVNYLISEICHSLFSKGITLVIATSHISARWGPAGPIPNKYNTKGANRWQDLSILTLILTPGDTIPIPAGIVQKEALGLISIDREPTPEEIELMLQGKMGHTCKRRLPLRISKCTFQEIRRYLHEPADLTNPEAGEVPTREESDPFDKKLSREQIDYIKLAMQAEERQAKAKAISPTTKVVESNPDVLKLAAAGKKPKEIAKELEIALPKVLQALRRQ